MPDIVRIGKLRSFFPTVSSKRQSIQSSAACLAKAKIQHQMVASGHLSSVGDAFCRHSVLSTLFSGTKHGVFALFCFPSIWSRLPGHDLAMNLARDAKWENIFPYVWKCRGLMQVLITHCCRRINALEVLQRGREGAELSSPVFFFPFILPVLYRKPDLDQWERGKIQTSPQHKQDSQDFSTEGRGKKRW